MNKQFFRKATVIIALVATLPGFNSLCRAQYTNGIYAEFNTSMGSYTCRLEYTIAPRTCASFIGLATGERAWLKETNGSVSTYPLHNGTIFHRVASNFVIQAGSPDGSPAGGPGYVFPDEFSPSLRHDRFGVLSMGNTGPDSNGSQYFLTVIARPDLDDHYSAFGRLYGGSNVVYAINRVATDTNEKPLTNVTIHSVMIRRIGDAAMGFNIHTNGLATVTNLTLKLDRNSSSNLNLSFSNRLYADTRVFDALDLTDWVETQAGIENVSQPLTNFLVDPIYPKQVFRAAQVQYSSSTFAPRNVYGRILTVVFTNGMSGTLIMNFNSAGSGTHTYNGLPGSIFGYDWTQMPYNGRFWPISLGGSFDNDLTFELNFKSNTGGSFTGVVFPPPFYYPNTLLAYAVAGTFTLSP